MQINVMKVILLAGVFVLTGSCSKPVKTVEYFKQHPEEIQIEAKRCLEDDRKGKQITKDKTCMNVITIESGGCVHHKRMMGGADFMPLDCEDPGQMLVMAAQGF
jgi:hypothetical protein